MKSIEIKAEKDHLRKIAKSKPSLAIAEIIWNSLDADATEIDISYIYSEIGTEKIIIKDNGEGFSYHIAEKYFGSLGGSWKSESSTSSKGRQLHGKQGQGRFKVFSLGLKVTWTVIYKKDNNYYTYTITGEESSIQKFQLTNESISEINETGVRVEINNLIKDLKLYDPEVSLNKFASIFAPYLNSYSEVSIFINKQHLDIKSQINNSENIALKKTIRTDEGEFSFDLSIFEWKDLKIKELYLCDKEGFPYKKYEKQIRNIGEFGYTAYLKSDYFSKLNSAGEIELSEMKEELVDIFSETTDKIKAYFVDRYLSDQKTIIDEWKKEKVYPYENDAKEGSIESAEQKVFDILAINLNDHISDFNSSSNSQKTLQLQLLRQAIENSPNDLKRILKEVINLPGQKIEELSEILEYSSLGSIISASKLITDRIRFIDSFEEIVFNPEMKKNLKERSQLHKILADNTWFFGDEFHLSVNDQSLTEVLKKYKQHINEDIIIDEPVKRLDMSLGIVDLMLSRTIPKNHPNESEHLVVELKAPKVKIGQKELNQIESYALAVAKDERFHNLNTRWEFWIISNELDEIAKIKTNQDNLPKGTILKTTKDINITIKVKTWSEIIAEVKHRHQFVQNQLNLNINKEDSMKFLQKKYEKYIGEIIEMSEKK